MKITKEYVENLITGLKTDKQIKEKLTKNNIKFYQDPYSDDLNLRIYNKNMDNKEGYIRIYKAGKQYYKVQAWKPHTFKYSGIPVFDPSRYYKK